MKGIKNQDGKAAEKAMEAYPYSWKAYLLKCVSIFGFYALLAHYIYPATDTFGMTVAQVIVYELVSYLLDFVAFFMPISFIAWGIAKVGNPHKKPALFFLNRALIGIVIGLVIYLLGGWNHYNF